ncbi:MAG: hypothetical protein H0T92_02200, partial [Pyrinomonadaceae bacterium]|nr:hypothetical protein [Pyrinomonadaceae bacterium]
FFPEKRPFFLEGIEVFRTPIQAVNTRAIVDPDYAVKLTGKRGRNTFGLLVASDNAPGNYGEEDRAKPDLQKFIDKNALIGVLRLKRDIGNTDSNIGLVATTYNFIERRNQLGGLDGRFRLNPQTIASFQLLATTSRRLFFDSDQNENIYRRGDGFAYSWSYDKTGRNLGYIFSGEGRTRDYRAGVGFTRRTNTNRENLFVRYSTDPKPSAKLISMRVTSGIRSSFDWQRRIQNWESESRIGFTLQRQTFFALGYEGGYDRLFEEEFGPKRTATQQGAFFGPDSERSTYRQTFYIDGETAPTKKYSASMFAAYSRGDFDFDFGAGRRFPRVSPAALLDTDAPLDPGPGDSVNINIDFDYQPTDALRASFEYTKSRLTRNDTRRVAFEDNVFSLRTTYQFTRFTFARVRLDYTTLSSRVRGQFLLGWTPNPGTSFYVGYNDDLNRNGYSPFTDQLEPGFRRNGRTFFIKMSYLIRRSL